MEKALSDSIKSALMQEVTGYQHSVQELKALRAELLIKAQRYTDSGAWGRLADCAGDLEMTEQQIEQLTGLIQDTQLTIDRLDEVLAEEDGTDRLGNVNRQFYHTAKVADGLTGKLRLWEAVNGALAIQLTNSKEEQEPVSTGMYLGLDEAERLQRFIGGYIQAKTGATA